MNSKIKNIIIFAVIIIIFILIYFFYIRKTPNEVGLVSSPNSAGSTLPNSNTLNQNSSIAKDFLSLLLNVKSIKLDSSILEDGAFTALSDSSIILTPDGTEGRPNPFAPLGTDNQGSLQVTTGTTGTRTPSAH